MTQILTGQTGDGHRLAWVGKQPRSSVSPLIVRFGVLIALGAIAAVVAWRLQQRRPDPPSAPSYRAPTQLDPLDFEPSSNDKETSAQASREQASEPRSESMMIVVFGSELCSSCEGVWAAVQRLAPRNALVTLVNVEDDPELHKRYKIDGVPTLVLADKEGTVRNAFFGPIADDVLADALPG